MTHRRRALLVLSEMTWYVTLLDTLDARKEHSGARDHVAHAEHLGKHILTLRNRIVSLASNYHGSCKSDLIFVPFFSIRGLPLLALGSMCGNDMARNSIRMLTLTAVRLTILRRRLLLSHPLPYRLPIQAPEGQLHDENLPPQHQLQRFHLFRYSP